MPRQTTDVPLATRAARERLALRHEPYWRGIDSGVSLGYRRAPTGGYWVVRTLVEGRYRKATLGRADDQIKADGVTYLDFRQAEAKARLEATHCHHVAAGLDPARDGRGPYTVADATDDYLRSYQRRGGKDVRGVANTIRAHILPELGAVRLDRLTRRRITDWHQDLAAASPRLRTKKGAPGGHKRRILDPSDEDGIRRRRSSANRVLTFLKAGLNYAHQEGRIQSKTAWELVKPFRAVNLPRVRFLTDDEITRLVNACEPALREIVIAGVLTGLRYGEITRLRSLDFNPEVGTLTVAISKSGRPRHVYLTDEGRAFFEQSVLGRPGANPITLVTATPDNLTASGVGELTVSGDGKAVAFDAYPASGASSGDATVPVVAGVYAERLQTGVTSLVAAGATQASLSNDGQEVAYVVADNSGLQVHVKNLVAGLDQLVSASYGSEGTVGADGGSDRPSLSADGQTVAFESSAPDPVVNGSTHSQIFVAQSLADVPSVTLVSAPESGAQQGDGDSVSLSLSADGTTVAFASTSDNLLAANSTYSGDLVGAFEIYVKALVDNAVTGQHAGEVTLVSGLADGTVADGESLYPSVSGDGRYVVFQSSADNLVPSVAVPSEVDEIYLKDVLTGAITLVSASASGAAADEGAASATISADGRTVVFESSATNLLPAGVSGPNAGESGQLYSKNLVTGAVTLLSEPGYTPGNGDSGGVSAVSADGSVTAFTSDATNLVAATDTAAEGAFHGYFTAVATTPQLTIQSPAASTTAATAVFTGTVDAADAGQTITVTDTADPGFAPVAAAVTPTSDPYVDRWTATVGLTIAGSQSVTATINGVSGAVVSATAAIIYAGAQSVTIDPIGVNGALSAAALLAGGTTVVTGTAMGAAGQTLQLS